MNFIDIIDDQAIRRRTLGSYAVRTRSVVRTALSFSVRLSISHLTSKVALANARATSLLVLSCVYSYGDIISFNFPPC
jgi:hypothetical protein